MVAAVRTCIVHQVVENEQQSASRRRARLDNQTDRFAVSETDSGCGRDMAVL
jgi:hypothetical protein